MKDSKRYSFQDDRTYKIRREKDKNSYKKERRDKQSRNKLFNDD